MRGVHPSGRDGARPAGSCGSGPAGFAADAQRDLCVRRHADGLRTPPSQRCARPRRRHAKRMIALPSHPPTLWALIAQRAALTPDRVVADDDRGRTMTAAQLVQRAERVAAGLQERGVDKETAVTWQLPTTMESVVLMSALARLGAVQNPLVPILRRREVAFIAEETGASLLITPGVWRRFDYAAMAASIAADLGCDVLVAD